MLFLGGQQETSATGDDLIILPHDRVGSDFSWLQAPTQKKPGVQKDDGFEAEESFLYGNKDTAKASSRSSETFCSEKRGRTSTAAFDSEQHHTRSGLSDLQNVQKHLQGASMVASDLLDSGECEKIKSILKCLGSAEEPEEERLLASAPTEQPLESSFSKGEDLGF